MKGIFHLFTSCNFNSNRQPCQFFGFLHPWQTFSTNTFKGSGACSGFPNSCTQHIYFACCCKSGGCCKYLFLSFCTAGATDNKWTFIPYVANRFGLFQCLLHCYALIINKKMVISFLIPVFIFYRLFASFILILLPL